MYSIKLRLFGIKSYSVAISSYDLKLPLISQSVEHLRCQRKKILLCSGIPFYFKDLFNHKKVSEAFLTGLLQNFRSTVNDTISDLKGSNR